MKTILSIFLAIFFIFVPVAPQPAVVPENLYPEAMIVVAVDYESDIVTCETSTGIRYEFFGTDDWHPSDIAACIMDSVGTEIVYDDEILSARYSGWVN